MKLDLIFQSAKILLRVLRECFFTKMRLWLVCFVDMLYRYLLSSTVMWASLCVERVGVTTHLLTPAGNMKIVVAVPWLKSVPRMDRLFDLGVCF